MISLLTQSLFPKRNNQIPHPYRDDAGDHAATALCAAHVSSSGRQKRIEVRAMGWSVEGRRLTTANNEGSVTTWSGLDFSHLNTTQHHTDRDTGAGVAIHALAWLRDGTSFVTGDAQARSPPAAAAAFPPPPP
jgi:hypothetical protein